MAKMVVSIFHFKYEYNVDKTKRKYQVVVSIDWDKPWLSGFSSIDALRSESNRIYKILHEADMKYKGGYTRTNLSNLHETILYNFYCEKNLVTFKLLIAQ